MTNITLRTAVDILDMDSRIRFRRPGERRDSEDIVCVERNWHLDHDNLVEEVAKRFDLDKTTVTEIAIFSDWGEEDGFLLTIVEN